MVLWPDLFEGSVGVIRVLCEHFRAGEILRFLGEAVEPGLLVDEYLMVEAKFVFDWEKARGKNVAAVWLDPNEQVSSAHRAETPFSPCSGVKERDLVLTFDPKVIPTTQSE